MLNLYALLSISEPTEKEITGAVAFFPVECFFHFEAEEAKPLEEVPVGSIALFREYGDQGLAACCKDCRVTDCPVPVTEAS